jgi:hypothetical protein
MNVFTKEESNFDVIFTRIGEAYSSRDIYQKMFVRNDFITWNNRMLKCGLFSEGKHYAKVKIGIGKGHAKTDYLLTPWCARLVVIAQYAMMGKQIRKEENRIKGIQKIIDLNLAIMDLNEKAAMGSMAETQDNNVVSMEQQLINRGCMCLAA